jgi:hypothetical protein
MLKFFRIFLGGYISFVKMKSSKIIKYKGPQSGGQSRAYTLEPFLDTQFFCAAFQAAFGRLNKSLIRGFKNKVVQKASQPAFPC